MSLQNAILWLLNSSGVLTVAHSGKDVLLLLSSRCIRQIAYGCSTLILALYFKALGHSDERLGLFMTLTLLGDVVISLWLTSVTDSLGRRRVLILGAMLMVVAGFVFATASNYWILLGAAIVGVISPSGNEIGPFKAIEESTLAHLVGEDARSDIFAWYVIVGALGMASGTLACGWSVQVLQSLSDWTEIDSYRTIFWIYSGLGVVKGLLSALLSKNCDETGSENDSAAPLLQNEQNGLQAKPNPGEASKYDWFRISKKNWSTLMKICLLFALNSLASGMVTLSLVTYYVDNKFHVQRGKLGSIMSGTLLLSAFSNIFSSAISKHIGPIKAMVFTHLPSAIFLALTPAPSSLGWTIFLIAARSSVGTMDQAPCSVFLCAIFPSNERTTSLGILNAVKMLSHSGGPVITGVLMHLHRPWVSFVIAGGLKALYDLGLLTFFARTEIGDSELGSVDSPSLNGYESLRSHSHSTIVDRHSTIRDPSLEIAPKILCEQPPEDALPVTEGARNISIN